MNRKAKKNKKPKENNKIISGNKDVILEELKNTKEELNLLKKRFNLLFERTNDAIFLTDVETMKFEMVNQKAMDLFGFTKDEMKNFTARDFVAESDKEDSESKLAALLSGKTLPIYERAFRNKSGELFHAEINLSLIVDHVTNRKLLQSILRDITERKITEVAKERERRVFQKIANAAIQTTDIHEFCNRVLTDLLEELDFNFGTLRILDKDLDALVPIAVYGIPDHLTRELSPIRVSDDKYIISYVIRNKKPIFTGNARNESVLQKYQSRLELFNIIALLSWPILDKNNNVIGALQLSANEPKELQKEDIAFFESIAHILTNALERLQAEQALEEAFHERQEINRIIELSPAVIFLWRNEEDWPVEYVSKNVNIFGYSPDEFYSRKIDYRKIIHPNDLEVEPLKNYDQDVSPYTSPLEYRIITKDGSIKWVIEYSTPRVNKEGKITHYHGLILDITERRKQEEFLVRDRTTFKLVAEAAVQNKIVHELCQNILEVLITTLQFNEGLIRIFNSETNMLKKIAEYNLVGPFIDFKNELHIDTKSLIVTHAARTKEPVFAPTLKDFDKETKKRVKELGIESYIAWPILSANKKLFGIIQLSSNKPKDLTEEDKILFASIANLFATALERIYTEQALLSAYNERKELDDIINLSPAIVFLWENKEGWPVDFVSDNVVITFGYTPDDFYTGRVPYSSIVHPDDLERVANEEATYSRDKERANFTQEYRIITKDGETKWTFNYVTIRRDEKGNITHFHGIVLDTTERKRAEESLKNERKAFQIIAEATATANTLPELYQRILNGLIESLGFDVGSIRLYNEADQLLELVAGIGIKEITSEDISSIPIDSTEYINALVARTKEAIFAPDVSKHVIAQKFSERLNKINIKAVIAWPILGSTNELIGILQLASHQIKEIAEEDKIVFETITGSVVNAIERLLANEARRESEQKYIAFAEQTLTGVFLFNTKGDIIFINEQAQKITEYSIDDVKDLNVIEFLNRIHPNHDAIPQLDTNKVLEGFPTAPVTQDFELTTKSDKKKWVSINLTPIQLPKELVFAAMLIDITSEKQAQLAINREREILELISAATANNLFVSGLCQQILEGMITTLNLDSGTVRLFNKSNNSLDPIANYGMIEQEEYMLHPVSLDDETFPISRFVKEKKKIFATDAPNDTFLKNFDLIKKHNYKVYISWPIFNAKDELLGTLQLSSRKSVNLSDDDKSFFDSITDLCATAIEHLQVLENLSESEERFKRTVDTMADGIIIIENNKIVYANDRALKIYGYPKEEFVDEGYFFNIATKSLQIETNDITEIINAFSNHKSRECWIDQKNGTRRYIRNSFFVEYDDNKEPIKLFIATTDITERKIAEEALQKLNEELEVRVAERTEQLARVNKELEAFSYSVSHDLRSPLRSIDGFSKALLEDYSKKLDDTGKDYLNRVRTACSRMGELIDDMLDLSRLTRKELHYKDVNLSNLVNDILSQYQINEPDRNVKLKIEDNIIAFGDPSLLRTVMENLLGNAWKFTNRNHKSIIEFGLKTIGDEKAYYVQDNGVGFDMKYADKLFAVFQRLHTYKEFKGTGVGLAVVQRIINRHNGRIWAESRIGKGATFYFTLQLEQKTDDYLNEMMK